MPPDHEKRPLRIALVGNPNAGKSSLFNALTGLRQKVGNFPGVTVDKKTGATTLTDALSVTVIDLPGTYSLYPKGADEAVTQDVLLNPASAERPDALIILADASALKRNLLFCSQVLDLRIPAVIALTMLDIAKNKGISVDVEELERQMGVPVVAVNPRKNRGIGDLKRVVANVLLQKAPAVPLPFIPVERLTDLGLDELQRLCGLRSPYAALQVACLPAPPAYLNAAQRMGLASMIGEGSFPKGKVQAEEIMERYRRIGAIMTRCVVEDSPMKKALFSERLDKVLLHPAWGNIILLVVLFLLFQSIYLLAQYPMDAVEWGFAKAGSALSAVLPAGWVQDLLINGLLAGLSGVAVFIPQIAILFGLITLLEDTGYMARISFLTDRLMRSVGLNGRSVMPLISGVACAVPAIMAARSIQNKKERLITILVTPLMSCSARLPVYTILIGLVIPRTDVLRIFSLRGLVLMGLYLLGFAGTLFVARILDLLIKSTERTYFLMELPVYRAPRWKNIGTTMVEKARIFVTDAGKVIVIISLLLWVLASFGPPGSLAAAERAHAAALSQAKTSTDSAAALVDHQSAKLERSFAGIIGHGIEPVISPLGFDWKIGIALVTSFAAREVFVGTMATLYSVGERTEDEKPLRTKMAAARRPDGTPVYTLATGLSLLVFYVFAMQCMSTLAVVKRETHSWKWPVIQFLYMGVLAWISAWLVYQIAA